MSVKLMSAIFETEFRDLEDEHGNNTKASTAKFVTLALADHANDEGEGAYPSIDKLARKTDLSRTCIINTLDALKFNGIILLKGRSKRDTNDYTINKWAFPKAVGDERPRLLVNRVDPPQSTGLTPPVNRVDPNHHLTVIETSFGANAPLDWKLAHEQTITEKDLDEKDGKMRDSANLIAVGTGVYSEQYYQIAYAFQKARDIIIPESRIKGQRKAIKEMLEMGVEPKHVEEAVKKLLSNNMTVMDLFSISKTAISLANPAPEANGYNPQGLSINE